MKYTFIQIDRYNVIDATISYHVIPSEFSISDVLKFVLHEVNFFEGLSSEEISDYLATLEYDRAENKLGWDEEEYSYLLFWTEE